MLKSDFISIVIKLFGLNYILSSFGNLMASINYFLFTPQAGDSPPPYYGGPIPGGLPHLINFLFYFLLGLLLIRFSSLLARKMFHSEKDSKITAKLSKEDVFQLIIMGIGILIFSFGVYGIVPSLISSFFVPKGFLPPVQVILFSAITPIILSLILLLFAKKITKLVFRFSK